MPGFKARAALSVLAVLLFSLSCYLLLSANHGRQFSAKYGFVKTATRFRSNSTLKASSNVAFLKSGRKALNCSHLAQLCEDLQLVTYKQTYEIIPQDVVDFRRVLLVVTFNKPHFEAIPNLHQLYLDIFADVIYCVPSIRKLPASLRPFINISIVEYAKEPSEPTGAYFYMCLPYVLDILPVEEVSSLDGVLTISDDLIPNLWHFRRNRDAKHVLRNRLWLLNQQMDTFDVDSLKYCRGFSTDNAVDCDIAGKRKWKVQMDNQPDLQALFEEDIEAIPNFFDRLSKASHGGRRVFNNYADLFYVSNEFFDKAYEILSLFGQHKIYMEFAVGTALRGIVGDLDDQIDFIDRSGQLGPEEVNQLPSDMYDARRAIYHPFKLGRLDDDPVTEECVYCSIAKLMKLYSQLERQ